MYSQSFYTLANIAIKTILTKIIKYQHFIRKILIYL